jgi:predicted amidohydrolase YtcJ
VTREPAQPLRLSYLIKAGAVHSMTGETYRSVGLRGSEIVAVSRERDGLDDLVGSGTRVVDEGELTLLPAFADSHEHLMEASRNTLLVPVGKARSVAEFTGMVSAATRDSAPGEWILTAMDWHESNLAENRLPTMAELDVAAPDHPVLARRGGHFALANSGSRQTSVAQFACASTIGHRRRGSRWLRRVCRRIESSAAPKTSFWRWSKAPLPTLTGCAPA